MNTMTAEVRNLQEKIKQLRLNGKVPGCVYGAQFSTSLPIQVEQSDAEKLIREKGIGGTIEIEVDGQEIPTIIKEIKKNRLKNEIEHIGFQALEADKKVKSICQVVLENREKVQAYIAQGVTEIPYSAAPEHLVETVTINMEDYTVGSQVFVKDLAIAKDEHMKLLIDEDTLILSIIENKRNVAESAEAEEA